jgi:type I restriction enzyme, S subunit
MTTFAHYPEMRDSGNRWVGEIPRHWEVAPLGGIGRFSRGSGGTKEDAVRSGVPCVRYGDLYAKYNQFITTPAAFVTRERAADYTPIRYGDLLLAGSGETIEEIGKSAVNLLEGDACCGGDVVIFRPTRKLNARFLGYAADCAASIHQKACMGRGITVMHIYLDELRHLRIAIPPGDEQDAIVRFVDHADGRIRRAIRAKQKLIALLDEQKQAVIHSAVTRGLDPSVQLKPSGVDWLGDLPEHWQVWRSKRLFSPSKELARPDDVQLSATQAFGVIAQDEYEKRIGRKVTKIFQHLEKRRHVEVGDFVISMRSFEGGLERAWATGCIRSSYVVLRPSRRTDVGYFSHLFKSPAYIGALQCTANFIRDGQDLNFENFSGVDLPLPPIAEQAAIAEHVGAVVANTLKATQRARGEIALLRELRTRLIADVVTGKLDVRGAASLLPGRADGAEPFDEFEFQAETEEADADVTDEALEEAEA